MFLYGDFSRASPCFLTGLVIFAGAVAVALAESGGEGRGFSGSVQMGEVSEAGHAEDGLAGHALFGRDDGDA